MQSLSAVEALATALLPCLGEVPLSTKLRNDNDYNYGVVVAAAVIIIIIMRNPARFNLFVYTLL